MRKIVAWIAVMLLCVGLMLPAQAESAYPLSQGIATDLADVLSESTVRDLKTLSERMNNAGLGKIYVVTRHFLGGTDAADYAQALFSAWKLEDKDVLLLLVIGEEAYALQAGAQAQTALSRDTQTSLLATHFRAAFLDRKYDEATADAVTQLSAVLAKTQGTTVSTAGLFGVSASSQQQPAAKPQLSSDASLSSVWESMFSTDDYAQEDQWPLDDRYSSRSSFNWRGWLIWGLVIYFLFFRKKRKYNFGHGPKRR